MTTPCGQEIGNRRACCQVPILDIKLKTQIKNPKATTKITQQKSQANKPIKESKYNHNKNIQSKGSQKRAGSSQNRRDEQETNSKMVDLNHSNDGIKINYLNTTIKRQSLSDWIKKSPNAMLPTKRKLTLNIKSLIPNKRKWMWLHEYQTE